MRRTGAPAALALAALIPTAVAQDAAKAPAAAPAPAPAQAAPAAAAPKPATAPAAPPAAPAPPPLSPAEYEKRVDRMLSAAWLGDLLPFTRDTDITATGYEAAMALALRCARMAPDRRPAWDMVLLIADQVEAGKPDAARAARREALAALASIDPADDVVRLARVSEAIESHPTAEARVRAYESVLSEKNRAALGAPVASRLAYALASLESRIGNSELFARWLADSVKTDPSYPTAAQAAAGFFRMRVNDPASDVELLSLAIEANPRDLATWNALLAVLLDGGAFRGAERVARMTIAVAEAERRSETVYAVTGDLATALWASGQRDVAMRELEMRMGKLTDDFRRVLSAFDPSITLERLNREYPPLPSTLSIAMLGLARRDGDAKKQEALLERAIRGTDAEISRAKGRRDRPEIIGGFEIQKAVITLLFSKDTSSVPALIESAAKSGALGEQGKARFEAMLAWRQGKGQAAIDALAPMRAADPLARYAYASALSDAKRTQEAAQEYRALAEEHIGTSIGLLALDRLAEILKQPNLQASQLAKPIADRAAALDKAVDEQLPKTLDELVDHPLRGLAVEITPSTRQLAPYEPLSFHVRMRNSSRMPLAIGGDAPISGKIVLRCTAPRAGQADTGELPPQQVLVDRRLRLQPGEELALDVDADLTVIGLLLNVQPLDAHLVTVAMVSNPSVATGGLGPGFMGTVSSAPPIQSTGVQVTEAWLRESREIIKAPGSIDAMIRVALLVHAAADPKRLPESERKDTKALWDDIVAAWKALPEKAQAWVVSVMPEDSPAMAPLIEAARATATPSLLRGWAITRVVDPKDAMLDVCRRTGDAELTQLADAVEWVAERRAKRAIEEVGVDAGKSRPVVPPAPAGGKP
jgi:hypothetical protein